MIETERTFRVIVREKKPEQPKREKRQRRKSAIDWAKDRIS